MWQEESRASTNGSDTMRMLGRTACQATRVYPRSCYACTFHGEVDSSVIQCVFCNSFSKPHAKLWNTCTSSSSTSLPVT